MADNGCDAEEVSEQGVAAALHYRQQRPKRSAPGTFALALAKEREWMLLTGDVDLRELSADQNVECHGVLWLLDLLEAQRVRRAPPHSARNSRRTPFCASSSKEAGMPGIQLLPDGLETIAGHPRFRLPRREITIRLERYRLIIGPE